MPRNKNNNSDATNKEPILDPLAEGIVTDEFEEDEDEKEGE